MRTIKEIAKEIRQDWGNKTYFGAEPYLQAMEELISIEDNYYHDDASSVIAYFLANATTYRGEVARKVKKELNLMLKNYYNS